MRLLLPCLLLSLCSLALAQDWREIKPPPTRRDMATMYQVAAPLDPLADPLKWPVATHSQSAVATVAAGEGMRPAQKGLAIHYDFSGREGLEYVDLQGDVTLPEGSKSLGLWMRGSQHALSVNVRVLDKSGEVFQFGLGKLRPGQWTLGVSDLANGGHWGGDNNGQMDPPLRLTSIIFDKISAGFKATGDVQITQLATYTKLPARLEPHGFKLSIPQAQKMLVYDPAQPVTLRIQADTSDKSLPALPLELTARLVDPFGQVAQTASFKLASAEPVPFTLTPASVGAYDLQLRLQGKEAELDAPWADFRFAVMPEPPAADATSPFGVSTHYRGWDYQNIMPLQARAGIKYYRDELAWGSVEQEKGKLAMPDRLRAYLQLGKQLSLEPLIIADYTNKLWEPEGDFPIHPESRAAFARYAGFLAKECPEVRNWEIWNEWTGGCGMGDRKGTAADYAPVFLESAKAIRAVTPQATVTGIGGEWDWAQFKPMMSGGAGRAMSAATIHPYMYPSLPGDGFAENLKNAWSEAQTSSERGRMDLVFPTTDAAAAYVAATRSIPLWITEIGWPTQMDARGSSFLHQSRCLVRMMVIALARASESPLIRDIERIFWYDFKDDGTDLTYNENNFGLVHHDSFALAPKPAYVAYAHLISKLHGMQCDDVSDLNGLRIATFGDDDHAVGVMWMEEEGQLGKIDLPAGSRAEDMFGRTIKITGPITVTQDPIFVFSPLPLERMK